MIRAREQEIENELNAKPTATYELLSKHKLIRKYRELAQELMQALKSRKRK